MNEGENMTVKIDLATAKSLVAQVVAERGEGYIYPLMTCQNVWEEGEGYEPRPVFNPDLFTDMDGYDAEGDVFRFDKQQPGCIVGAVMFQAGYSLDDINVDGGIGELVEELPVFTDAAYRYLEKAQQVQDLHQTWGAAKSGADELVAESSFFADDTFNEEN
jgi:hypothetical protein